MQILITMKKKLLLICMLAGGLTACTSDLTGLNEDIKNPPQVPPGSLFSTGTRLLVYANAGANQYDNVFRVVAQYWQQTTYNEESQYKFETRSISGAWWRDHYHSTLQNFKTCKMMMALTPTDEKVRKNQLAIVDIMEVVTYYYLVTTFGNVPYTQALNDETLYPAYDDAKTIYSDLMRRLTADIAALDETADAFGQSDLLYEGDVAAWKKFAASFKLKMALLIADSDVNAARTAAEDAIAAGVFTSRADDCRLVYLGATPYNNPVYEELVESGRADYVANATIVDSLKSFSDPRLSRYFKPLANGNYVGAAPGLQAEYDNFSPMGEPLEDGTLPAYLLDYAEVKFLLAEAAQRGWNTGGTAADHYNTAIRAALESWDITDTEIDAYLALPKVAYNAADWKRSLGMQKWFAFFNRGHEGWTDYRRLDFPKLPLPRGAVSGFPMRYKYPITEHNVNRRNYEAAAQAVGGDEVETKLWWDKF